MGFYLQISSRLALSFMMVTWILLVLGALGSNHGTPLVYVLFSALYLMLLISAFYRQRTYGYTFLVVMLWLGFWLKSTWHRILGSGFPEPIGQFAGTSEQWDRCFFVAMAAALGIVGARMAIHFLAGGHQTLRSQQGGPPSWLKGNGPWHWGIFALVVSVTSVANFHYEIFVVGLKTGTILPWPLNALITLMVAGGGFALWMATLLWYEIRSSGRAFYGAIFLILAALIITSSSLSRGMIVMLLIPIFYSLYLNFNSLEDLSRRSRRVFLFLVLLAVIIINFFVITHLRDGIYYQSKSPIEQSVEERQFPSAIKPLYSILKKGGGAVNFAVDRWIGIEGVMAVSTYPELGGDLFNEAIFESLVKDGKSLYAKVAPWPFSSGDKLRSNVGFMSLPGGAAFLYYSGSFFVVFFGAFVVAFLVQFSEIFVYALTRNPILCASYGWAVAVWFAHFGGTPRAQLPTVLFLFSLIALFGLIQAKWLGSLVVLVRRIMSLD